MSIEAMKQALEALEKVTNELFAIRDEIAEREGKPTTNVFHLRLLNSSFSAYTDHAIPAAQSLRQAIREHALHEVQRLGQEIEQEPVAWRTFDGEGQYEYRAYENNENYGLWWEERHPNHKGWVEPLYSHPPQLEQNFCPRCGKRTNDIHTCTPPQRTEPPDWFPAVENILNEYGLQAIDFVADFKTAMKDAEKSQRTWQGLTDEEIIQIVNANSSKGLYLMAKAIEAKLKERNT